MHKGNITLIPCPIFDGKIESLPSETIHVLHSISHFIVERAKTARHFIKASGHPMPISSLFIHEMTQDVKSDQQVVKSWLMSGANVGIISEAGCPGIADPGAEIVSWAHCEDISVKPLVGPSSILLALMASGMNGQRFVFHGYLSNKKPDLLKQLANLEIYLRKSFQTQIWMETPYRNGFMIESCIQAMSENTLLCVACDINSPTESIVTRPIKWWKTQDLTTYHKRPAIFIIG